MCDVWLRKVGPSVGSRGCCGGFNVPQSTPCVGAARASRCGPDAALGGVHNGGLARAGCAMYCCEKWVRVCDCVGFLFLMTRRPPRSALFPFLDALPI